MTLNIVRVDGTDFFVGEESRLRQVVIISLAGAPPSSTIRVDVVSTASGVSMSNVRALPSGEARVSVPIDWETTEAPARNVTVTVATDQEAVTGTYSIRPGVPGWNIHFVPHFHYDPVWWNTQAAFVSEWETMPVAVASRGLPEQKNAFELMRLHLDKLMADPDYKFVVSEIDYLKPWWETHPDKRAQLQDAIKSGRIEVVGGSYNEPQTNLIGPETTMHSAIFGMAYQKGLLGGAPTIAWQLDVFGHDPQYPAIMADAGLHRSSWARGPFHEWGPMLKLGTEVTFSNPDGMQFLTEFYWMSPSGQSLLTSYMTAHYSAGWWMDTAGSVQAAEEEIFDLFVQLQSVAAAPTVMIPVGNDHTEPNRWISDIQRDWSHRFVWPRTTISTPREYFEDLERSVQTVTTQTRDMNPIFSGTHVSFIDTKQAHRSAENTLVDAEKFAAFASQQGAASYPKAELDLAWRQLVFASHHDAITGSESDQVYIDLLGSWREAWSIARDVRERSLTALAGPASDQESPRVTVFNPIAQQRSGIVTVQIPGEHSSVFDDSGSPLPAVREQSPDGQWHLTFQARDVPSIGYRTYEIRDFHNSEWRAIDGSSIDNQHLTLTVDSQRGGAITSIVDRVSGRELVNNNGLANEIRIYDEYPNKPLNNELGPWYVSPKGPPQLRSGSVNAEIELESCAVGKRIIVRGQLGGLRYVQKITLWHGEDHVDCTTELDDFAGADQLVRIAWPCDVPGALPLAETGTAVIGRGFAHPNEDAAIHDRLYDAACYQWFGLGSTARIRIRDRDTITSRAIGVAEIVSSTLEDSAQLGTALARALVRAGVTSTNSLASGARYGDPQFDSNSPDVRFAIGTPETNDFVRQVLQKADPAIRQAFELQRTRDDGHGLAYVPANASLRETWKPGASVTGLDDLPVIVMSDASVVERVCADLTNFIIDVPQPPTQLSDEALEDFTVALLNRGTPSSAVDRDGTLYLSVLRSCTGWPSGVWLNPPVRTTPDGSAFQLQHWSHIFEYAFTGGHGDWRALDISSKANVYNHPMAAVPSHGAAGSASFVSVEPSDGLTISSIAQTDHGAISLRLSELHGHERSVDIRMNSAHKATLTDLLGNALAGLSADFGKINTRLPGYTTQTIEIQADRKANHPAAPSSRRPQPSRYWVGGTGAAPIGNLPNSVTVASTAIREENSLHTSVVVARDGESGGRLGELTIRVIGDASAPEEDRLPIDLTTSSFVEIPLTISSPREGTFLLECVADFDDSESVFDSRAFPSCGGDAKTFEELAQEIQIDWDEPHGVEMAPGSARTISVQLSNRLPFTIHGELQFLSPWGTWEWSSDWKKPFTATPGVTKHAFRLEVPFDVGDGFHAWALVKATWAGAANYSPSTELRITNS